MGAFGVRPQQQQQNEIEDLKVSLSTLLLE
jgi:hypothetical protein